MRTSKKADSISTYLGSDGSIEGTIEFKNTIRLDGNVKGKIFSDAGTVIIGEKAVVNAEIHVDVAVIMGTFNGTIDARERIEIYPPGHVVGDIQAPTIMMESGVVFNGNCSMKARTISSKVLSTATDSTRKSSISEEIQAK
ncbi:MAG: polymer-forming cytoskeletal protein [Pseudomonadota bacterium]|uniref:Polymer-forming cytoskeletal protein n=1 Tax=Candidatus Desulfatibia profunda TaxID=2841695 RepID=A0A8J6NMN8_9BACT|nr:polymer-forming cytoskeletal protein [Candidatus Desulfatibia profunda]MBL7179372.1 polymer-forming cytoskeletal protein [Desulfobacterales bacterium]